MARPSSYPLELRKRAVRMVAEVRSDHPNESAAIKAVAGKLGVGSTETLRKYVAFVVDTSSRRIVGWPAATSKETRLVLDSL
ncbi:hypothetical protein ABZ667_43170, partial [Streptomyces lavendulae]